MTIQMDAETSSLLCDILQDYAIDQEDPSDPGDIRAAKRVIAKLKKNPTQPNLNQSDIELIYDWADFYICEVSSDFIAYIEDRPDHATPQDLEDLKVAKADQQRLEDFCSSVSSFIG